MAKILVVDDMAAIRTSLREILTEENHEVEEAKDGEEALRKLEEDHFDIVFCDVKMPKIDGIELLERVKKAGITTPFIIISAHGTKETALECIKRGAYFFIQKPFESIETILIHLRNVLERNTLREENRVLKKKVGKGFELIGESASLKQVKDMIEKVGATDARVLITGPNGSGKELVARNIHAKSKRSESPIVEVNCAAIPSELIESELFGHEKGSFTSAIKQRIGKFEQAEGGTLFLDEIGDMSLSAQAKVLRALQENKITRVGGEKEITVNVRIIAATNKDLKKEIQEQRFREDLYHRLSVIVVKVPSLDERKEDIPLLVEKFLEDISESYGSKKKKIDSKAVTALQAHNWTGNIRELRNVVERLVIMSGDEIVSDDVKKYL
ncbi:MAG TPA: sigma-54 dependent transcriptional regulator [Cyclobacteriaceae bacterium]|nr:sigma-54 dependent transcriptional regulator [Cyclobacteriaceae bacterium]HMV09453.1 sigma-54 dependent transcriptional regulator [Cyclobacteriaceae bacterium]HMV89460.1 sigma-54 dependent transcriptional regulator [Cyclobacteriaceae bacterium]HMX02474.1 sigma-54 dependent transcriptional regulator [Cyclobacteriaceae bacterium]HMX51038.1 sigma-54 dependent transcriptional regulator [Cyclobacteriaceae bacterium]